MLIKIISIGKNIPLRYIAALTIVVISTEVYIVMICRIDKLCPPTIVTKTFKDVVCGEFSDY